MKLSTKSRYALEGLLYLSVYGSGQPMSIREISAGTGISASYMEQIFIKLKKSGLVATVRGSGGGFTLGCPEEDVTVTMVIHCVEGTTVPVKCVENLSFCTSRVRSKCLSRNVWVKISEAIVQTTNTITLNTLTEQYQKENEGVSDENID